MKALAIIDAQMRSTHLPGKVLRPLADKPVLWHVVHRLRQCAMIDDIAISTSSSPMDDAIAKFGEDNDLKVFRGDEDDIVGRVGDVVEKSRARSVVVIGGDMPLFDPDYVDVMVAGLEKANADLVLPKSDTTTNHKGIDVLSRFAVEKLNAATKDNDAARFSLVDYLIRHPGLAKVTHVDLDEVHMFTGFSAQINDGADLERIETIVEALGRPAAQVLFGDVVDYLKDNVDLVNEPDTFCAGLWADKQATVVVRCDAGSERGYGSLMRCLSIATILRDSMGLTVHFAMASEEEGDQGASLVEVNEFPLVSWPRGQNELDWLKDVCEDLQPSALLVDVETDLTKEDLSEIGESGVFLTVIDDITNRRLVADAAFYPPSPQAERLRWNGAKTDVRVGWQWVAMSPQFSRRKGREVHNQTEALERAMSSPTQDVPKVLISFGGADPKGLTWKVACQLQVMLDKRRRLSKTPFDATFVVGPGSQNARMSVARLGSLDKGFKAVSAPDDFADLAESHDLAVVSFGVTAFELTHLGLPSVLVCLDENQVRRAAAFESADVAHAVHIDPEGSVDDLVNKLVTWLDADTDWRSASNRAKSLLDGGGAYRIAEVIADGARQSHVQQDCKVASAG